MTSEQLQQARAELWRQTSNPILTSDDANAWMDDVGLCLFLPRHAHFSTPAPSLVEAVTGARSEAPNTEAVGNATTLLHRMAADGHVVPLNLFGEAGGGSSDQPDFLATRATLPYIFSMVGGRNWKSGPGTKASPLMTEVWTLLSTNGAMTASEMQSALGRELTEAAVLRAVVELWRGLRAIPTYKGETTQWELTQARFATEMTASQAVAQTTALSVLVALYLESVIAASAEEIETFLSPLAARSRIREVVNGLSATRQVALISVGAQPLLHVVGSLPEFAEEPAAVQEKPADDIPRGAEAYRQISERKPFERGERKPFERERKPFQRGDRKPFERGDRPRQERGERAGFDRGRGGPDRRGPRREGSGFASRGGATFREKPQGDRPYRKPEDRERRPFEKKPFGKKQFDRGAKPFSARPAEGRRGSEGERGERRDFSKRGGNFGPTKFGTKPYGKGPGGERPWQNRGEKESGGRPASHGGAARGGSAQRGEDRQSFRPRREDRNARPERSRSFGAGTGERKGTFRSEKGFGGNRKFDGPKKFGAPKFTGKRDSRPRDPRPEGEGAEKRVGGWKPKSPGGSFSRGGKPAFKSTGRLGFKGGSGKPSFKSSDKPGFKRGGKPGVKPGFKSSGKTGFSSKRPGGFKPPFRKRKQKDGDSAE